MAASLLGAVLIGALVAPSATIAAPPVVTDPDDLITTAEDTPVTGNVLDNDGGAIRVVLPFTVSTSAPGTLDVATDGEFTFTPTADYNGAQVLLGWYRGDTDAIAGGEVVTYVWVDVTPVNDVPVAAPQGVATAEDTPVSITLHGSDPAEGSPITYSVAGEPDHGTLTGTAPNVTYHPEENWNGQDIFEFTVNDGTDDSDPATVTVDVAAVNDQPVAEPQAVATDEDTPVDIVLAGEDPADGSPVTFSVASGPTHGRLAGAAPNLTYTPDTNWSGEDALTFTVNDGAVDSAPATVSFDVAPVNDVPVAAQQDVYTNEETPVAITLHGSDVEIGPLTYTVEFQPSHGDLSGTAPNVTYTPEDAWSGQDTFTFTVDDGSDASAPATVTVNVGAVDDVPVADPQTVSVAFDTAQPIILTGSDAEGAGLTFTHTEPAHGDLSGASPNLTYTPDAGYVGTDSFTFRVIANDVLSAPATVSIVVADDAAAPTSPTLAIAFGTGTVKTTAPLKISWAATDAGVGGVHYLVQASVDGGAWTNAYTGAATSVNLPYRYGHTYRWQVKAADANDNWTGWTLSTKRSLTFYQGARPVTWSGTWRTTASKTSSGGSYRYSTRRGARVQLSFTGLGVLYVAPKLTTGGYVKVLVDGSTYRMSVRSGTSRAGQIIKSRMWASSGTHTVRVINDSAGRRAPFDAFVVMRIVP